MTVCWSASVPRAMTAGATNSRAYKYYENGLARQVADNTSNGTPGAAGGADYFTSTASTTYDYTVNGERAQATFSVSSAWDTPIYDDRGVVIDVGPLFTDATSTRVTQMSYDAQGRLAHVKAPSAQNAGHASISDTDYYMRLTTESYPHITTCIQRAYGDVVPPVTEGPCDGN